MQSVSAAFTAEARADSRQISQGVLISWKKDYNASTTIFTVGVSTIGGTDVIGGPAGTHSAWNRYRYFEETDRVLSIDYERSLNMPMGGLSVALANVDFDNNSGRYTPSYMGGGSEFATAVLPRRPIVINAGFVVGGVPQTIPQFVGVGNKQPQVDLRNKTMRFPAADFNEFLANRFLDKTSMYTGQRTDQLYETMLQNLGYGTAQYSLDVGINTIPFALFEKGTRYSDIIHDLAQAEFGHFYQDEEGVLRFENRQHWDSSPHNSVSMVISTSEVIDARAPDTDHIINVVEVRSDVRSKQPLQTIYRNDNLTGITIGNGDSLDFFVDYEDPVLSVTNPSEGGTVSFFVANSAEDGSGTDLTSSITLSKASHFAHSSKFTFSNSSIQDAFITQLVIAGRPAKKVGEIYHRAEDDSSVTAFEERPYTIENDYIQDQSWAETLAQLILSDFGEPENLQEISIKAQPQLQLGDLISWQGRYWRVFGINTRLDPSSGFIQDLKLLQRTIQTYFRIGISTIGGTDRIAP